MTVVLVGGLLLLDLPLNWLHMGMGTRPTREEEEREGMGEEIEGVVSLIRIAHLRRHCARRK